MPRRSEVTDLLTHHVPGFAFLRPRVTPLIRSSFRHKPSGEDHDDDEGENPGRSEVGEAQLGDE